MRQRAAAARNFVRKPDASLSAALIHGGDQVLVSQYRKSLVAGLLGDRAGDDTVVTPIDSREAGRDPALVLLTLTMRSMFSGRGVAILEGATDRHVPGIERALGDSSPEDSFLVATAGELRPVSKLRKLFESATNAVALLAEAEPWSAADIRKHFTDQSLPPPVAEASELLAGLSRQLDWGGFRQLLEKLSLYASGSEEELNVVDVEACAPGPDSSATDPLVDAVATGQLAKAATHWRALEVRGVAPSTALNAVLRHFLTVNGICSRARSGSDIERIMRSLYLNPARRTAISRDARGWSRSRLEGAVATLHAAEIASRGGSAAPSAVIAQRAVLRVAGSASRRSDAGRSG